MKKIKLLPYIVTTGLILVSCSKKQVAPVVTRSAPPVKIRKKMEVITETAKPPQSENKSDTKKSNLSGDNVLIVDDFNRGEKPNALGGNYGGWDRDPLDKTQYCNESFSPVNHGKGQGYSIRLDYDVDSPNPAFNGFWMKLNEQDLSGYEYLIFYIKGDADAGYTTRLKVELKNNILGERASVIVDRLTSKWQKIRIPLKQFSTIQDWTKISEFVIVFDDEISTWKAGTIYLDDIYFVKK